MAKTDFYKYNYLSKDFSKSVKKKMLGDYTQEQLGKRFGMSQQTFGYHVNNASFRISDLAKLFDILGFSNDEILKIMGR